MSDIVFLLTLSFSQVGSADVRILSMGVLLISGNNRFFNGRSVRRRRLSRVLRRRGKKVEWGGPTEQLGHCSCVGG